MQALDEFINQVKTLPPAPRIFTQLICLLGEDDVDSASIVELIVFDPALTAKILHRCNQAARGLGQPIHSLPEAVMHLGFNEIYRCVAAVFGESMLCKAQLGYGIAAGELWRHSATAAIGARCVARSLSLDENLTFTAALLHDIGKLVLSSFLEGTYTTLMRETCQAGHSFMEAEKAILGVEHAEVGGRVLARWNLPENLVRAVWHHHDPALAEPHAQLAAAVYLGDMIAHVLGQGHGHQAFAVRGRAEALDILQLAPAQIDNLVLETELALRHSNWFTLP